MEPKILTFNSSIEENVTDDVTSSCEKDSSDDTVVSERRLDCFGVRCILAESDTLITRIAVRCTMQTGVSETISSRKTHQKAAAIIPTTTSGTTFLVADKVLQHN